LSKGADQLRFLRSVFVAPADRTTSGRADPGSNASPDAAKRQSANNAADDPTNNGSDTSADWSYCCQP